MLNLQHCQQVLTQSNNQTLRTLYFDWMHNLRIPHPMFSLQYGIKLFPNSINWALSVVYANQLHNMSFFDPVFSLFRNKRFSQLNDKIMSIMCFDWMHHLRFAHHMLNLQCSIKLFHQYNHKSLPNMFNTQLQYLPYFDSMLVMHRSK